MKRRITWSIVGVSAIALLVLGVPLAIAVGHLYRDDAVLQLEREASEARRAINVGQLTHGDPVELTTRGATQFALYNQAGQRMSGVGPALADDATRRALRGKVHDTREGGRIVVAIPVDGNERVIAALRASRPGATVTGRTHRAWLLMSAVGVLAVGVSALLGRRQARRLTRPVDALVDAADRLGAGDLSVRTSPSGVPELDELGASIDVTAQRLGGLLARERSFSADASHQLRTPIAALRVAVESTLMAPAVDARETLRQLLGPIDRLEATVDELLALACDTHADRVPLDLTGLLAEIDNHWRGRLAATGRPLRIDIDEELAMPLASTAAVRQILDVLLTNADRHGAGIVTIRARRAPGATVIDVADEGPGAPDTQTPFVRRSGDSHGIGLSLARTLAEAEGGRLNLAHTGPHPVFSFVIPVDSPRSAGAGDQST